MGDVFYLNIFASPMKFMIIFDVFFHFALLSHHIFQWTHFVETTSVYLRLAARDMEMKIRFLVH